MSVYRKHWFWVAEAPRGWPDAMPSDFLTIRKSTIRETDIRRPTIRLPDIRLRDRSQANV